MFRPSPCPNHYDGRLATMPSADFCLKCCHLKRYHFLFYLLIIINRKIIMPRLICTRAYWFHYDRMLSRSPQIRTCTVFALLHHLRWPLDHVVSSSCANSPLAYASYDVLVHQLASLLEASSRPTLTDKPLPFASI